MGTRFTIFMLNEEINSGWENYLTNKHDKLVYWVNSYIQHNLGCNSLYWMVQELFETSYDWGYGIEFKTKLNFMESVKQVIHNFLFRKGYWKNVKDWESLKRC